MEIDAPQLSESDTWVMEPSDDWPVFMAGDPDYRLMNAIPDDNLPRYTPPDVTVESLGVHDDVSVNGDVNQMDTSNTVRTSLSKIVVDCIIVDANHRIPSNQSSQSINQSSKSIKS
jgi:hypothetical protein